MQQNKHNLYHKTESEIMQNWSNRSEPILSIICITYNHIDFIAQALNSFLEQETDFGFEILIHDDCSTDGTKEVIEQYAKKYPNIIKAFYEEVNQYQQGINGRNFNAELHKIAAKYIALCEGDDYWNDPKKLQIQVDFMENNPNYVVCYHSCEVIDSYGNAIKSSDIKYRDSSGYDMQRLKVGLPTRCVVYRNVIDFFEPNLSSYSRKILNADTFLWTLLGEYGDAKYLKEIKPAVYRIHKGGVWSMVDEKERFIIHSKSFFNMSEYFAIKGNAELASFFLSLSMSNLIYASSLEKIRYSDFARVSKSMLGNKYIMGGGDFDFIITWDIISTTIQSFKINKRAS